MILYLVFLGLVCAREALGGPELEFIKAYYDKVPYMDIRYKAGGSPKVGRVRFKLHWSTTPYTVLNFAVFLAGKNPYVKASHSYKNNAFHRIIPTFMMQGGDITHADGTGGTSIYGPSFEDENFKHKHEPGVLSMANRGPDTNSSQFFITFGSYPHLDGLHVVFGKVLDTESWDVVKDIEKENASSPQSPVEIVECGFLERTEREAVF